MVERNRGKSNRERKAIDAVACPDCRAPRGILCRRTKKQNVRGRIFICEGRRKFWQMVRAGEVEEVKEVD